VGGWVGGWVGGCGWAQRGTTEYYRIPQPTTEHHKYHSRPQDTTRSTGIPQEAQEYHEKHNNTTRGTGMPQEAQEYHKKHRNTTRRTGIPLEAQEHRGFSRTWPDCVYFLFGQASGLAAAAEECPRKMQNLQGLAGYCSFSV
jgi:hypothetical protein